MTIAFSYQCSACHKTFALDSKEAVRPGKQCPHCGSVYIPEPDKQWKGMARPPVENTSDR